MTSGSTLIRQARLVPIGTPAAGGGEPVDLRIADGVVTEVGPTLNAEQGELVLDAAGRWAIPGLWDQHVHLGQWARTRIQVDLSGSTGPDDVVTRLLQHLRTLPVGLDGGRAGVRLPVGRLVAPAHRAGARPRGRRPPRRTHQRRRAQRLAQLPGARGLRRAAGRRTARGERVVRGLRPPRRAAGRPGPAGTCIPRGRGGRCRHGSGRHRRHGVRPRATPTGRRVRRPASTSCACDPRPTPTGSTRSSPPDCATARRSTRPGSSRWDRSRSSPTDL